VIPIQWSTKKNSIFSFSASLCFHKIQIIGTPATITKPYRPRDSVCYSPRSNKFTNDDDGSENSIDDGEKSKAVRSPSTFQQQTSSIDCNQGTVSLLIFLTIIRIIAV
jgi:hypothetical protein